MAREDEAEMYDFGAAVLPVKTVAQSFARYLEATRRLPRRAGPHQTITKDARRDVSCIERALAQTARLCAERREQLCSRLRQRRVTAFRANFDAARVLGSKLRVGTCLICVQKTQIGELQCCKTASDAKTVCRSCAEDAAFESSLYGTRNEARCPFCLRAFAVYADPE